MLTIQRKSLLPALILTILLVLTGCASSNTPATSNTPVPEAPPPKPPESTYNGPKVSIGQPVGPGMVEFLNNAEFAANSVVRNTDSHDSPVRIDNGSYKRLMPPYDMPGEIQKYFQKYWSKEISDRLYTNLRFKTVDGICYTVVGNLPSYSMLEDQTIYTDQKEDIITLDAFYRFSDERTESHKVTYKLQWVNDSWIIIERTGDEYMDFPFS